MTQIKIFEFEIKSKNNSAKIEEEINYFLDFAAPEVIDIKTDVVQVHTHNNGGDNTNKIIYTIIYK